MTIKKFIEEEKNENGKIKPENPMNYLFVGLKKLKMTLWK